MENLQESAMLGLREISCILSWNLIQSAMGCLGTVSFHFDFLNWNSNENPSESVMEFLRTVSFFWIGIQLKFH